MSYRRRQRALWQALSDATGKDPVTGHPITNRQGWGLNIEPGVQVTTFGRHGAGQPAIDGKVVSVENGEVIIRMKDGVERRRSISHVRKVGR